MYLQINILQTDDEPYEPGEFFANQMEDPEVYWKYQEELNNLCDETSPDFLPDIPPV